MVSLWTREGDAPGHSEQIDLKPGEYSERELCARLGVSPDMSSPWRVYRVEAHVLIIDESLDPESDLLLTVREGDEFYRTRG